MIGLIQPTRLCGTGGCLADIKVITILVHDCPTDFAWSKSVMKVNAFKWQSWLFREKEKKSLRMLPTLLSRYWFILIYVQK